MKSVNENKVPPDGGYGWVVTFAYALNNVVVLPLITSFGLVFQEAFEETNLSATQGTLVITLNHGIGMLLSFLSGPILKRFGYRKVAVVGAFFISAGLMITAFASSFWVFILSYSVINSMGIAAVMAAFSLAINSFFKEKRAKAVGVGMSLTGLGAITMPLLISLLMNEYGWRHAVLILGAICLHSLLAACLLRPAKWYLISLPISEEMVPLNKNTNEELNNSNLNSSAKVNGELSHARSVNSLEANQVLKSASTRSLASTTSIQARNAISHPDLSNKSQDGVNSAPQIKWWESQEINLGSSINIFKDQNTKNVENKVEIQSKEEIKEKKTFFRKFVDFFDLTLLSDPVFVNILIGLSIAACVETNFSLLFPIILKDMLKFETSEIGYIMSTIGLSDTMFRLVSAFLSSWCKKSPRVMYMVALVLIILVRTMMLFATTFTSMIFVALAIGITKGVRTVYMNVVIPSYVPLERLPFASGIQMLVNGFIIISIGSLLGKIREASGSYHMPIIVLNAVTLLTIIMWTAEFLYFKINKRPIKETMTS